MGDESNLRDPRQDPTETVVPRLRPAPPQRPSTEPLRQADGVGRYSVLSHLGSGGMGSVYAAYDPDLDRKVALKLVRRDRASKIEQQRLLQEARALAKLSHPNIVRVYDVGFHGESVFFAMELVSSLSLRRWLLEQQPSWRQIVHLFLGVGRGLATAHEHGLVHRDLKPDNILVGDDGSPRIADFGLAKWMANGRDTSPSEAASSHSAAGDSDDALGTPAYMAPELASGRAADELSDQYSFCVALYVALFGLHPRDESGGGDERQATDRATGAGETVPARLRKVVFRGLQDDPTSRYASMSELVEALSQSTKSWNRRWPWVAMAGTLAVALGSLPWLLPGHSPPPLCADSEERFVGIWDAEKRQTLTHAFSTIGSPLAMETAERVVPILDRYRSQWIETHREACMATRIHGVQSERMLDLRMLCLERRREEARALTDLLIDGGEEVLPNAVRASQSLSRIAACEADAERTLVAALPQDAARRRQLEQLEAQTARQTVLFRMRRGVDEELIASIVEQADALGYAPLQARARHLQGQVQLIVGGDATAGVSTLELALANALAGGDRPLVVILLGKLAEFTGFNQGESERGKWWGRFAETALAGLGPERDEERFLVHSSLGLLAWSCGQSESAEGHWQKALRFGSAAHGADNAVLAEILNNLALVAEDDGDAIRFLKQALRSKEQSYGGTNPLLANSLVNLAGRVAGTGCFREALPYVQQAADVLAGAYGPDHPYLAYPRIVEAELLNALDRPVEAARVLAETRRLVSQLGLRHPLSIQLELDFADSMLLQLDPERAESHLKRATELASGLPPESPALITASLLRGRLLLQRGDHQAARAVLEADWLRSTEAKSQRPVNQRIALFVALAEADLRSGRSADARLYLEQALEQATLCNELPALSAETRFLLAQAVEKDSPERAIRLARDASEDLPASGSAASRRLGRQIALWLVARAH
ncbi:MAG: serine/threonine-protein kinase [Acidobacteriota bacterium]